MPRVALPASWERGFEQLRERFATLGMHERSGGVDEFGMDEEALRARATAARSALRPLLPRRRRRDRARCPSAARVLLVANAAGILPYDALMIAHAVERARGERPRFAVADWLIALPFVQPRLAQLGGVRACPENVERLLAAGRSVAVFPEGIRRAPRSRTAIATGSRASGAAA